MSKNQYRIEYETSVTAAGAAMEAAVQGGMDVELAMQEYLRAERMASAIYEAKCKPGLDGRYMLADAIAKHDGYPAEGAHLLRRADALIRGAA